MLQEPIIRSGIILDPKKDGITHINVYTGGNTVIGREGSNLFHAPTDNPRLILRESDSTLIPIGKFDTIEGCWWWFSGGMVDDYFRTCDGFEARKRGSSIPKEDRIELPSFKHEIRYAIALKYKTHPEILDRLINSTLPLTHYYVYGKKHANPLVRTADRSMWVIKFLEEIRESKGEVINKILT